MKERKYLPSFAELIDRAGIVQLKIINSQNKEPFENEMKDILHDIQIYLDEGVVITADILRAIILLTQSNLSIWTNEDFIRSNQTGMTSEQVADALTYTHKLNANRSEFKTKIQNLIGGRTDVKINYQGGIWEVKW